MRWEEGTVIKNETRRRRDHFFYTGMAVAIIATVFAGFARTYYLKAYTGTPAQPWLVHLHGIVFTGWTVLFLAQALLIRRDGLSTHRKVGIAGAGLACLMVLLGYEIAIAGARRGFVGQFPNESTSPTDPLAFLIIGLGDLFLFLIFFTLGFHYRSRPEVHKRLMLLATINVLPAAVTRIPLGAARLPIAFTLLVAFIAVGPIYDRLSRGRVQPVSLWGGLAILASVPLRTFVGSTAAWHALGRWLIN
jgi:hypothetical protein